MEDVKTLKAEREVLEKQLKEPVTDISKPHPLINHHTDPVVYISTQVPRCFKDYWRR